MAKSTIGSKKDPQDIPTSERRRVSPRAAQNGVDETATQQARPRRKPASRRESDADRTIGAAAPDNAQNAAGRIASGALTTALQASAEQTGRPSEVEAAPQIDVPHEHIAVRAYHLYLERGGRAGDDFEDWVTAERELRERATGQRPR
jgi:hypothetical protein